MTLDKIRDALSFAVYPRTEGWAGEALAECEAAEQAIDALHEIVAHEHPAGMSTRDSYDAVKHIARAALARLDRKDAT